MRTILLALVACLALGTQAQTKSLRHQVTAKREMSRLQRPTKLQMQATPAEKNIHRVAPAQGEPQNYNLAASYQGNGGNEQYNALAATVTVEGSTYTFNGLFPEWPEAVISGTREGNTITFDQNDVVCVLDQTMYGDTIYDIQFGTPELDAEGYITGVKNVEFAIDDATGTITSDPNEYVMLYSNQNGTFAGFWALGWSMTLTPVADDDLAQVTPPESAVIADYIYTVQDLGADGGKLSNIAQVAIDGNDYYLNGVCEGWIKGTRDGDVITFATNQYLGAPDGSRLYFYAGIVDLNPESGNYAVQELPESMTFTVDADGTLRSVGETSYALTLTAAMELYAYVHNIVVKPYTGDVIATPVDPEYYEVDFQAEEEFYNYIAYDANNEGLNGEYLNPARMKNLVYYDDEPYTFDPEIYCDDYNFDGPMTEIPFDYIDYDFYSYGSFHQVFLADMLFEKIGVQSVYYCEGQRKVSNIVYIDQQTGEITKEYVADAADYKAMLQNTLNEAKAIDFDALDELTASALNVAESAALDVLTDRNATVADYDAANTALKQAIADAKNPSSAKATGINEVNGQQSTVNAAIYNLQGQRVSKAQKGLYIVNGKKVAVK